MAGSWRHMTTRTGKLRRNDSFTQTAENLGDAYETAEECYGMIWYLAGVVVNQRGDGFGGIERTRQEMLDVIAEAGANYQQGLRLGGVQGDG